MPTEVIDQQTAIIRVEELNKAIYAHIECISPSLTLELNEGTENLMCSACLTPIEDNFTFFKQGDKIACSCDCAEMFSDSKTIQEVWDGKHE